MRYIEGVDRNQRVLLPDVLDDFISETNPARVIDAYVDSLDLHSLGIGTLSNETGRPPYNPRHMLKLYVYGYMNKIRSSRRLEREAHRNVELMWLLDKLVPDHKTIANFRKDNAGGLKNVFRDFVQLSRQLGIYGGELMAIDGSKFSAVNSLDSNYSKEKLDDRIRRIDARLEKYLSELDNADNEETDSPSLSREEIAAAVKELADRKRVYGDMLADLAETGDNQLSTTDPDSRRMKQGNGGSDVSFNVQTAVDAKHNLVIDYEVSNQCNDKNLLAPMAISANEALGADGITALADTGYFVASDIAECLANGITPHVSTDLGSITMCVPTQEDEVKEPGCFDNRGKNIFIRERNIGVCPMGNILYPNSYRPSKGAGIYSNKKACKVCPRRESCKEYDRELQVKMSPSDFTKEHDADGLRIKQITYEPDKELLKRRKAIAEHPFGTVKRGMDSGYCLMKGIDNVRGEFALTFLAYNMKRAINILGVKEIIRVIRGGTPSYRFT
jgi:transposase